MKPQTCETPPVQGGASRDKLAGGSRNPSTLEAFQAQILIVKAGVRPEWAAMLAGFAFGGGGHG